jgi:hypothetical protein
MRAMEMALLFAELLLAIARLGIDREKNWSSLIFLPFHSPRITFAVTGF